MAFINDRKYAGLNNLIAESYDETQPPYAQGQKLHRIAYGAFFIRPNHSPSISQKLQAYTAPLQRFYTATPLNTPSGDNSAGRRLSQPNQKFANTQVPIVTSMPWDL